MSYKIAIRKPHESSPGAEVAFLQEVTRWFSVYKPTSQDNLQSCHFRNEAALSFRILDTSTITCYFFCGRENKTICVIIDDLFMPVRAYEFDNTAANPAATPIPLETVSLVLNVKENTSAKTDMLTAEEKESLAKFLMKMAPGDSKRVALVSKADGNQLLILNQLVVARESQHEPGKSRYELFSTKKKKKFSYGAEARIFAGKRSIKSIEPTALTDYNIIKKPPGKKLLLKCYHKSKYDHTVYDILLKIPYLKFKPLPRTSPNSYRLEIMRDLDAPSLATVLEQLAAFQAGKACEADENFKDLTQLAELPFFDREEAVMIIRCQLAYNFLNSLAWLHQTILHGDLKPDNILVKLNKEDWLIDFGFAQFLRNAKQSGNYFTPAYYPIHRSTPSQVPTVALDIFAAGRILAEIFGALALSDVFPNGTTREKRVILYSQDFMQNSRVKLEETLSRYPDFCTKLFELLQDMEADNTGTFTAAECLDLFSKILEEYLPDIARIILTNEMLEKQRSCTIG